MDRQFSVQKTEARFSLTIFEYLRLVRFPQLGARGTRKNLVGRKLLALLKTNLLNRVHPSGSFGKHNPR